MKIRKLQKKDAKQVNKLIEDTMKQSKVLKKREQKIIKKQTSPEQLTKAGEKEYFICEHNGKIIGVGALKKGEIINMYTSPNFQKKGVGSLILRKIEKQAKKNKIEKLFLYTHPESERFYLKNNYKRIKKFKDKKRLPVVYMEKIFIKKHKVHK